MDEILYACPFCGADGELIHEHCEYVVRCRSLGSCYGSMAEGGHTGFKYKEDAIELWNRRPTLERKVVTDDEAKQIEEMYNGNV